MLKVGAIQVHRVVELERWAFPVDLICPTLPPECWAVARERLAGGSIDPVTGELVLSVHSFVVQVGGRTLLIDSCNGNHKPRPAMSSVDRLQTDFIGRLARAGVEPADIDLVMCTHLHADHIGWNTRLADGTWVPTFPHARYLFGTTDFQRMEKVRAAGPDNLIEADVISSFEDSVLPVVESGQAEFFEAGEEIERDLDHGIWVEAAPGHTSGHVIVHLESGGERAIASGDTFHHLFQLAWPQHSIAADQDPGLAAETRRRLFERAVDDGSILLPAHLPSPTVGRVVDCGDRFGFAWLDRTAGVAWGQRPARF